MFAHVLVLLTLVSISVSAQGELKNTDIPCTSDEDCLLGKGNNITAVCLENTCAVSVHVAPPSLKIVTRIGSACTVHEECNIDNAECSEYNLCVCANNTIASFHQKQCLAEAKKIGDECIEDVQCNFPDTTCQSGACVCNPGYGRDPENRTLCRELNGIGASCSSEDDCEVEHTKCENGTCVCTQGFTAHKRECYEESIGYLSRCDHDFQCQKVLGPDATCIKKSCHCQRKYVFSLIRERCVKPEFRRIFNNGAGIHPEAFLLPAALAGFLLKALLIV